MHQNSSKQESKNNQSRMQALDSSDKSKDRQISQCYVKIQENCEFLTNIRRKKWKQVHSHFFSCQKKQSKTQQKGQQQKSIPKYTIQIRSFLKVITQLAYLLYTCHIKKKTIYMSKRLLVSKRLHSNYEVYLEYILGAEFQEIIKQDNYKAQFVAAHFQECALSKAPNIYAQITLKKISQFTNLAIQYISIFQIVLINQQSFKIFQAQLSSLSQVLNKFMLPYLPKFNNPRAVIQCLQETEMFRQNATILKVFNCSLYSSILTNQKVKTKLKIQKEKELLLIKKSQENNSNNTNLHFELQLIIDQFIIALIQQKIISMAATMSDKGESNKNQGNIRSIRVCQADIANTTQKKLKGKFHVYQKQLRHFNQKLFKQILQRNSLQTISHMQQEQEKKQKSNHGKNEYQFEYIPQKNLICVKFITDIELSIQNTDIIMYQCNNIPFDLNSVTLELIDRNNKNQGSQKKRQKVVAFKTISHFDNKEQPLTKILLLVDLVMISAKIFEPELKKTTIKLDQYWKVEQSAQKANHLISLFMRKLNKTYSSLGEV